MEKLTAYITIAIVFFILVWSLSVFLEAQDNCKEGVLVKGSYKWECIKNR